MPFQDKLSPFVGGSVQKSAKKPTVIQPVSVKRTTSDLKAIKFISWDEESKSIKLCMDLKKYNYLFRTGPAAFVCYVTPRQENNSLAKLSNEKNLPLIDSSLNKGIYIWNHVIYNEHKNISIYQLQCILSEQYTVKELRRQSLNIVENIINGDTVLMAITSMLASEIVFILNNSDDEILENYYQMVKDSRAQVINIVNNQSIEQFKWQNLKFTVVEEYSNQLCIPIFSLVGESLAEVMHAWQLEMEMTLEKKLYRNLEIDFLSFFSVAEIITKNSIEDIQQLKIVDNIYHKAISKQIKYEKDYIEAYYYRELREFCSTSEQMTVESLAFKLNQMREQAMSLYFLQLNQFAEYPEFEKYKQQVEDNISEHEQDCIKYCFELMEIEITQQFEKIEKKFKEGFPENYTSFLGELLKFSEYRGLKYEKFKNHIQVGYTSKVFTFITEHDKKEKISFDKRMQSQNEKQCFLLKQRDKELLRGMEILQNYTDLMREEIATLKNLQDFNKQINVVVQLQLQVKKLDEEIKKLKWWADKLEAQKK